MLFERQKVVIEKVAPREVYTRGLEAVEGALRMAGFHIVDFRVPDPMDCFLALGSYKVSPGREHVPDGNPRLIVKANLPHSTKINEFWE